jgi:hypothetical protein
MNAPVHIRRAVRKSGARVTRALLREPAMAEKLFASKIPVCTRLRNVNMKPQLAAARLFRVAS